MSPLSAIARFASRIRGQISTLLKTRSNQALFLLGLLNGLLPCELTYVTLAKGNAVYGMAYMALFGLGTLPMIAGSLVGQALGEHDPTRLPDLRPLSDCW